MSQKQGWIRISREVKEHWVYKNPDMFRAWVTILITSNFKDGKMVLGKKDYTIKRGQSSMSLRSWANELDMGVKAVTTLFDMLEQEEMIKRKTIGKGKQSTTLITIINYGKYQSIQETLEKRKGNMRETLGKHEGHTIEEGNNVKNEKNAIPLLEDFLKYAIENKPKVKKQEVELKYNSWVANGWMTGGKKPRKIVNWKTTLLNTLPHMSETSGDSHGLIF